MDTKIVQGSSPRMRGTRVMQCDNRACGGIIPAYAGNTIQMRKAIFNNRDHPRVCGEHPWYLTSTPSGWRIIPAYAGNTPKRRSVAPRSRDHPRVCGEHDIAWCSLRRSAGSSPRMRGTPGFRRATFTRTRIIPAYAGNTPFGLSSARNVRDHPRVCGEHRALTFDWDRHRGSSPRMRGTPNVQPVFREIRGIIPAYAGNTYAATSTGVACGDHPRVCGEHPTSSRSRCSRMGSSPRMRGTQSHQKLRGRQDGIIPAYAGNTQQTCSFLRPRRDHPRVCGEHLLETA